MHIEPGWGSGIWPGYLINEVEIREVPDYGSAARRCIVPEDFACGIAIEVANSRKQPGGSGVWQSGLLHELRVVDLPGDVVVGIKVVPQQIVRAITIKIANACEFPASAAACRRQSGLGHELPARHGPDLVHIRRVVMPQNVVRSVTIEVATGQRRPVVRAAWQDALRIERAVRVKKPHDVRGGSKVVPQYVAAAVAVEVTAYLGSPARSRKCRWQGHGRGLVIGEQKVGGLSGEGVPLENVGGAVPVKIPRYRDYSTDRDTRRNLLRVELVVDHVPDQVWGAADDVQPKDVAKTVAVIVERGR